MTNKRKRERVRNAQKRDAKKHATSDITKTYTAIGWFEHLGRYVLFATEK